VFPLGVSLTLRAEPFERYRFAGWSGACTGKDDTCTVTMNEDRTVRATFVADPEAPAQPLTVKVEGVGAVSEWPEGRECASGSCTWRLTPRSEHRLQAIPGIGWRFGRWAGSCTAAPNIAVYAKCRLTRDQTGVVATTAIFIRTGPFNLGARVAELGTGTIVSSPPGIHCPSSCDSYFTEATLKAVAAPGYAFHHWEGTCSGTAPECRLGAAGAGERTAVAVFALRNFMLSVTPTPNGSGAVVNADRSIACPLNCAVPYPYRTVIELTARPSAGWQLASWSGGGCSGNAETCRVTMGADTAVIATFAPAAAPPPPTTTAPNTPP
jgi:hypothetical protein